MNLFSVAFSLFLLMDSIGNIPLYITFLKGVDSKRHRLVILREMGFALAIIILFNFLGNPLMDLLHVREDTIQIAGGIILFLICLKMIFPTQDPHENLPQHAEPFIVPLAVPLVAGPAVLAAVMIYARQEDGNNWIMVPAILLAWGASLIVLLSSTYLKRLLGWRGILALERLMGLLLTLIAIQMLLSGISSFIREPH